MYVTIVVDFFVSRAIAMTDDQARRRWFLALGIASNLSILGFFKYCNFFMSSFEKLFHLFGLSANSPVLNIVLPVGISFYTFQSMSYVIDVYRRQLTPAERLIDYAAYVTYFPQLVAGPIERASHLLPQMLHPRCIKLDAFYEGCYLIFWGLFKKMFIADNLAQIVDPIFSAPPPYNGAQVLLGIYAFAFQIYCDFSGYSDIARGLGKTMGFDIMLNFNLPYFATNPTDFWRRWHISLSTWLRDYLYVPLGGNRKGKLRTYRNLMLTMLLGGLWHGANWTYVFWGAYHGFLLCIYKLMTPYFEVLPKVKNKLFRNLWFGVKVIFFFHLVCLGWLIFRAGSLTQIQEMLHALFAQFSLGNQMSFLKEGLKNLFLLTYLLIMIQCFQYLKKDLMVIYHGNIILRVVLYVAVFYSMFFYGLAPSAEFIYFQF